MIQVGFLLLLCIAAVTAAAPPAADSAACVSTCKAVQNFDLTKLVGKWYQVRQIKSAPGREGKCETATYKLNADKTINADLGWIDSSNKPQKLSGPIITSGGNPKDGQLTFKAKTTSEVYTIFYVNYNKMFGIYTCINNKAYVFVLAKTPEVADGDLKDLNDAMTANGLAPKSLKPTTRTGC